MQDGFILSNIKRCNRNFLLANLIFLMFIGAITVFYHNDLYNYILGPFDADYNTLISIKDPDTITKRYYTVTGVETYTAGISESTDVSTRFSAFGSRHSTVTNAVYLMLPVKDRMLLVKTQIMKSSSEYSGVLKDIPMDVYSKLISPISKDRNDKIIPTFMLDATNKFKARAVLKIGLIGILILVFFINLIRYLLRLVYPKRHAIYRRLKVFGDQEKIRENIDNEVATLDRETISSKYITTPSWVFDKSILNMKISQNFKYNF